MSLTMPDGSLVAQQINCPPGQQRVSPSAPKIDVDEELRLSALPERIARFFERIEPRQQAVRYADALLKQTQRKNGWQIARNIGDSSPWRTQRLLNRAHWDVDGVRDVVRDYIVEHLGHRAGVLSLGEMATIKKGTSSVGVSPHYSTQTGRLENCQVAVFAAYVSPLGSALVDRELYLPGNWVTEPERRRRAGIPAGTCAATKVGLARAMVQRLSAAVSCSWVTGDVEYGRDRSFLTWLASAGHGYVLAIPASDMVHSAGMVRADVHGSRLPSNAREVRIVTGPEGRRTTWTSFPIALCGTGEGNVARAADGFEYLLLVERTNDDKQRDIYRVAHAPVGVPLADLIWVAGAKGGLDDSLRDARERAGIDQYEVRTWKAWYRHVTLAMLAVAPRRVLRPPLDGSLVDEVPVAREAVP
jgi:SRSO17 transposase